MIIAQYLILALVCYQLANGSDEKTTKVLSCAQPSPFKDSMAMGNKTWVIADNTANGQDIICSNLATSDGIRMCACMCQTNLKAFADDTEATWTIPKYKKCGNRQDANNANIYCYDLTTTDNNRMCSCTCSTLEHGSDVDDQNKLNVQEIIDNDIRKSVRQTVDLHKQIEAAQPARNKHADVQIFSIQRQIERILEPIDMTNLPIIVNEQAEILREPLVYRIQSMKVGPPTESINRMIDESVQNELDNKVNRKQPIQNTAIQIGAFLEEKKTGPADPSQVNEVIDDPLKRHHLFYKAPGSNGDYWNRKVASRINSESQRVLSTNEFQSPKNGKENLKNERYDPEVEIEEVPLVHSRLEIITPISKHVPESPVVFDKGMESVKSNEKLRDFQNPTTFKDSHLDDSVSFETATNAYTPLYYFENTAEIVPSQTVSTILTMPKVYRADLRQDSEEGSKNINPMNIPFYHEIKETVTTNPGIFGISNGEEEIQETQHLVPEDLVLVKRKTEKPVVHVVQAYSVPVPDRTPTFKTITEVHEFQRESQPLNTSKNNRETLRQPEKSPESLIVEPTMASKMPIVFINDKHQLLFEQPIVSAIALGQSTEATIIQENFPEKIISDGKPIKNEEIIRENLIDSKKAVQLAISESRTTETSMNIIESFNQSSIEMKSPSGTSNSEPVIEELLKENYSIKPDITEELQFDTEEAKSILKNPIFISGIEKGAALEQSTTTKTSEVFPILNSPIEPESIVQYTSTAMPELEESPKKGSNFDGTLISEEVNKTVEKAKSTTINIPVYRIKNGAQFETEENSTTTTKPEVTESESPKAQVTYELNELVFNKIVQETPQQSEISTMKLNFINQENKPEHIANLDTTSGVNFKKPTSESTQFTIKEVFPKTTEKPYKCDTLYAVKSMDAVSSKVNASASTDNIYQTVKETKVVDRSQGRHLDNRKNEIILGISSNVSKVTKSSSEDRAESNTIMSSKVETPELSETLTKVTVDLPETETPELIDKISKGNLNAHVETTESAEQIAPPIMGIQVKTIEYIKKTPVTVIGGSTGQEKLATKYEEAIRQYTSNPVDVDERKSKYGMVLEINNIATNLKDGDAPWTILPDSTIELMTTTTSATPSLEFIEEILTGDTQSQSPTSETPSNLNPGQPEIISLQNAAPETPPISNLGDEDTQISGHNVVSEFNISSNMQNEMGRPEKASLNFASDQITTSFASTQVSSGSIKEALKEIMNTENQPSNQRNAESLPPASIPVETEVLPDHEPSEIKLMEGVTSTEGSKKLEPQLTSDVLVVSTDPTMNRATNPEVLKLETLGLAPAKTELVSTEPTTTTTTSTATPSLDVDERKSKHDMVIEVNNIAINPEDGNVPSTISPDSTIDLTTTTSSATPRLELIEEILRGDTQSQSPTSETPSTLNPGQPEIASSRIAASQTPPTSNLGDEDTQISGHNVIPEVNISSNIQNKMGQPKKASLNSASDQITTSFASTEVSLGSIKEELNEIMNTENQPSNQRNTEPLLPTSSSVESGALSDNEPSGIKLMEGATNTEGSKKVEPQLTSDILVVSTDPTINLATNREVSKLETLGHAPSLIATTEPTKNLLRESETEPIIPTVGDNLITGQHSEAKNEQKISINGETKDEELVVGTIVPENTNNMSEQNLATTVDTKLPEAVTSDNPIYTSQQPIKINLISLPVDTIYDTTIATSFELENQISSMIASSEIKPKSYGSNSKKFKKPDNLDPVVYTESLNNPHNGINYQLDPVAVTYDQAPNNVELKDNLVIVYPSAKRSQLKSRMLKPRPLLRTTKFPHISAREAKREEKVFYVFPQSATTEAPKFRQTTTSTPDLRFSRQQSSTEYSVRKIHISSPEGLFVVTPAVQKIVSSTFSSSVERSSSKSITSTKGEKITDVVPSENPPEILSSSAPVLNAVENRSSPTSLVEIPSSTTPATHVIKAPGMANRIGIDDNPTDSIESSIPKSTTTSAERHLEIPDDEDETDESVTIAYSSIVYQSVPVENVSSSTVENSSSKTTQRTTLRRTRKPTHATTTVSEATEPHSSTTVPSNMTPLPLSTSVVQPVRPMNVEEIKLKRHNQFLEFLKKRSKEPGTNRVTVTPPRKSSPTRVSALDLRKMLMGSSQKRRANLQGKGHAEVEKTETDEVVTDKIVRHRISSTAVPKRRTAMRRKDSPRTRVSLRTRAKQPPVA